MHPMLSIAVRAARSAGNHIARNIDRLNTLTIVTKGRNDFVSEVDKKAEDIIIDTLYRNYPKHGFIAEESGVHQGEEDYTWIIDPLDGTTNFLHGIPHFAVSIALQHAGKLEHAVVYNPMSQELYTASRGNGASLNNRRIRVSDRRGLNGALLGTGFPFRENSDIDGYLPALGRLMSKTAGIRRAGSAALDLAFVAAGRLDGYWESDLKQWDIAAGALLVQEAGGLVTDLNGEGNWLESGDIIAASPKTFHPILRELNAEKTDAK